MLTSHSFPAIHETQGEEENLCVGEDFLCQTSVSVVYEGSRIHTRTRVPEPDTTFDLSVVLSLLTSPFSPTVICADFVGSEPRPVMIAKV